MEPLRDVNLHGRTIIEHRLASEGGDIIGRIQYAGVNPDGSFVVGWHHETGGNRTTIFRPASWACDVGKTSTTLRRTGADVDTFDLPWRTANRYTIEWGSDSVTVRSLVNL